MKPWTMVFGAVVGWFAFAAPTRAGVVTFLDDFDGFVEAAGPGLLEIDFETLPDGSPSQAGVEITLDFNYTDQGVTFTPLVPILEIAGNPIGGFGLLALDPKDILDTAIISELVMPASAVGMFFPGFTLLSAFDEEGNVIAVIPSGGAGPHFVGIVSDVPIALTVNTRHTPIERINSYLFVPIPEPSTLGLLTFGALLALRGRMGRRHARWSRRFVGPSRVRPPGALRAGRALNEP